MPVGYMSEFAHEHPEYWSRTRDGTSFLDMPLHRERWGYGYLGLAYSEVRKHDISL